jgi:hypothetical protein
MSRTSSSGQLPLTSSLAPAAPSLFSLQKGEGKVCRCMLMNKHVLDRQYKQPSMHRSLDAKLLQLWPPPSRTVLRSFCIHLVVTAWKGVLT